MTEQISFEVVTKAGQPIRTFDDRKAAVAYAGEHAGIFPGIKVHRVIRRPEERITIWTERRLRLVAGGAA